THDVVSLLIRLPAVSTLFPTRRSSDLRAHDSSSGTHRTCTTGQSLARRSTAGRNRPGSRASSCRPAWLSDRSSRRTPAGSQATRSEEHTSELQSRFELVCRLLLAKKTQ